MHSGLELGMVFRRNYIFFIIIQLLRSAGTLIGNLKSLNFYATELGPRKFGWGCAAPSGAERLQLTYTQLCIKRSFTSE